VKRILTFVVLFIATQAHADLVRFFSGNETDVKPKLHGPYLILAGGGSDQDEAMQAAIDGVRGCNDCDTKLDVVVLRASGAEGYNPWFMGLKGVNSVTSYVITDRASSGRPDVVNTVRNAELVFFAGGDQCNYVRWIKGTRTAEAVQSVYRRGGAIGGTSAGLAIQGEIVYDSCPDQSAQSKDVLLDPYSIDVSLSRDFFHWSPMRGIITDTHFSQRDRMGRLLVFMARALAAGDVHRIEGLGVSEATVVLVDRKGVGRVMGKGPVHVIVADRKPEVIERGIPLTYRGYKVWRFETGSTIDLDRLPKTPTKVIDVVKGKLSGDPY
jgi:cyanophycinase